MKKFLILVLLPFVMLLSCSEDPVDHDYGDRQTLVIITDHDESSEFMVSLRGTIRADYPDTEIQYFEADDFSIFDAAYTLFLAESKYPENTYFAAIVEPGANADKITTEINGKMFLMPDNGLGTFLFRDHPEAEIHLCDNTALTGDPAVMPLYDYYINLIALILDGKKAQDFGSRLTNPEKLDIMEAANHNGIITGQIMYTDDFGNCVSNISGSLLSAELAEGDFTRVTIGDDSFLTYFGGSYESVPPGNNVSLVNIDNALELAVNRGSISKRYNIEAGTVFTIEKYKPVIGILKFNESAIVEDIISNLKDKLVQTGLNVQNSIIIEKNADGNPSELSGLLKDLIAENPDLVISVSTPASQTAVNELPEDIPLLFTYVTDPQSAGLLTTGRYLAGCSDATNFKEYLNFVDALLPEIQKAGMMYSQYESNAVYAKEKVDEFRVFYDFDVEFSPVPNKDLIDEVFKALKNGGVEAYLLAADNMLSENIVMIAGFCQADKFPLIGDSYEHCANGALASISVNYKSLAYSTGEMAFSSLLGNPPDKGTVNYFETELIAFNTRIAERIDFTIPQELLDKAEYIYK